MHEALHRLGDTVPFIPDGETGERSNYILHLGERLAANPSIETGRANPFLPGPLRVGLRIRRGGEVHIELGELGYCRDWAASLALFHELREETGTQLRYQMGVAPALSIGTAFFNKPFGVARAIAPLQAAIRAEIAEAVRLDRDALAVQIDAAFEQIFVALVQRVAPPFAQRVALRLARQIAACVAEVPPEVPVGVHLCLGNPGNRRVVTPSSSKPVVLLANALAQVWPAGRPLDFVHIPIVDSPDPRHYEPLRGLTLPPTTRLIAGLVYEDGHDANTERLALASQHLGFTPDVACACGMGRRTPEVARALLDEMRRLAEARPSH